MFNNFNPQTVKKYLAYVLIIWLVAAVVALYLDLRSSQNSRQIEADKRSKEDRELLKQVLRTQGDLPDVQKQIDSISNKLDTVINN